MQNVKCKIRENRFFRFFSFAFLIFSFAFFAGCAATEIEISELEYKQILGQAICAVVDELNAAGELDDADAISENFDKLLEQNLNEMGYPSDEWLAAKAKYFPDEAEHTKLVKLHFTWCLVGDSFSE